MNSKALAVLAVAGLVLLAGCSVPDFGGNDNQTPETTEAPGANTYPTGVSADGVNAENLSSSHYSYLSGEGSFTVEQSRTLDTPKSNETFKTSSTVKVEFSDQGTEYLQTIEETGGSQAEISYANASMSSAYAQRTTSQNSTIYTKRPRPSNSMLVGVPLVQSFLAAGDYTVEQTKDGVRISASNITSSEVAQSVGVKGLKTGSFTAVVSDEGYIKSYEYSVTSQGGATLTQKVQYTEIGSTTVEEPDWFDTAQKEAAEGSMSIEQGNDFGVFSYENGVTLEQGARVIVTVGPQIQQAQLNTALEPGNDYYVYFKDGQLTFSKVQPGNPDDLPSDGSLSLMFLQDGAVYFEVGAQLPDEPSTSSGNETSTDGSN